ncbi:MULTISPECIES: cytochrome c biogenesis protein ResB [unclassified Paenibacillus]|uniref:cytochrome c biogenesis protein ResB n=1 Tax=unclassified Paenibacillus TaxID=185978 RepID=UPI0009541DA4|nr:MULTISPECIES: cytochrome c biogenesis protein ResB [unclassified Paenibacillus]ASS65088.1 cytochrome c biogenesis protein [Paenibacillus sp. RUD330]SIQ49075.1 cytochrome c biogenesis protein [Paenibacillus sp. RU4X]SIQ70851.1 cytochrome c biogenesis protein [Paenibacillus sp. RU4T]
MFQNTKCECGHQNPTGTVLCEACGKPLDEKEAGGTDLLEMRYDGAARRSQKADPSIIDQVWNFFSSVKIAVYLIIITLIGASLGTIYPQEDIFLSNMDMPSYYKDTYGTLGSIYYNLGLSHTYESWWFILLLVMIGTSLVICSLDRVLPLYRALNKQQIRKHESFLLRQKAVYTGEADQGQDFIDLFAKQAKKRHYKVTRTEDALLAEKSRFSRWGPYINHIGLIVFLLAVLARAIPSWQLDEYVTVPEGDTVRIENTDFFVKNEKFTVQYYKDEELPAELRGTNRAKLYRTDAVLYRCLADCGPSSPEPKLEQVASHNIEVNSPLEYKGLKLYQFDYDNTPVLREVSPMLIDKQTGKQYGPFKLAMKNPQTNYELGPYKLELRQNFMEFAIGEDGKPITKSRDPKAPAFIFLIKGPGLSEEGEPYIYFPMQKDKAAFSQDKLNQGIADRFEIKVGSMTDVKFVEFTTFLNVRVDKAMPYIWTGLAISMIGLIMGAYWQHRRIWLRLDGNAVTIGAHTNKNWYGMRADLAAALKAAGIQVDPKSLDNGGNRT